MNDRRDSRGQLDLLILAVLAHGPAHGYRLIKLLHEHSAGAFDLPEGTVYPALRRLEEDGLLDATWDASSPRRRRVYELSGAGREMLATEQDAWERFSSGVNSILGWQP